MQLHISGFYADFMFDAICIYMFRETQLIKMIYAVLKLTHIFIEFELIEITAKLHDLNTTTSRNLTMVK